MNANRQTKSVLEELDRAQECIGTLQQASAITTSRDASLSNSNAQIEITTLTNRLHVLEAQNAQLKSAAKQDKSINAMQQTSTYITHSVTSSVPGSSQPVVMDLELTGTHCWISLGQQRYVRVSALSCWPTADNVQCICSAPTGSTRPPHS